MKTLLVLVILFCTNQYVKGQTQQEDSSIAKLMQQHADTTIIIQYPSNWSSDLLLYIISKKKDTLNAYVYQRPKSLKINSKVPRAIGSALFSKTYADYSKEPVGFNRYFIIRDVKQDSLLKLWNNLLQLKLWKVKDDAVEGSGCPVTSKKNVTIDDGSGIYILLIDKTAIKPLNFYAPYEFEKFCPGRKGRLRAIKLSYLIQEVFKE